MHLIIGDGQRRSRKHWVSGYGESLFARFPWLGQFTGHLTAVSTVGSIERTALVNIVTFLGFRPNHPLDLNHLVTRKEENCGVRKPRLVLPLLLRISTSSPAPRKAHLRATGPGLTSVYDLFYLGFPWVCSANLEAQRS